MYETINNYIQNMFYNDKDLKSLIKQSEKKLLNKEVTSYKAAELLLDAFKNK